MNILTRRPISCTSCNKPRKHVLKRIKGGKKGLCVIARRCVLSYRSFTFWWKWVTELESKSQPQIVDIIYYYASFVCVSLRVFIFPQTKSRTSETFKNLSSWERLQTRFTRNSRFICRDIHLQTRCKVRETFSWSKPDLSYSVFTPQGRTSQLIPVTRKLQQPPLWQTAALHTSLTAVPWNRCELICLRSRLIRVRSFDLRIKNTLGHSSKMCIVRHALLQTYTPTGSFSWCNSPSINLKYTL